MKANDTHLLSAGYYEFYAFKSNIFQKNIILHRANSYFQENTLHSILCQLDNKGANDKR